MPAPESRRIPIRSFRLVTDELERRIFKVDRYRLPMPYGVPLRSLLYFAASAVGLGIASTLPLVGSLLGLLPASVRWIALPGLLAFALTRFEIDGRSPHAALIGWARFAARPKHLAGLRPCPPLGATLAPVHELAVAPSGEQPAYRAGRVEGPARVLLRYPAELRTERGDRRLRVTPAVGEVGGAAPLALGTEVEVPEGAELVFGR